MSLYGGSFGGNSTDRIVNALENQASMLENQRSDFRSFAQAVTSRINSNAERIFANASGIRTLQTNVADVTAEQTRMKDEQARLNDRIDSIMENYKREADEAKVAKAQSKAEVEKANARAALAFETAEEAKKAAKVNEANLAKEKARNAMWVRESMVNNGAKRNDLHWLESYDTLVAYKAENEGEDPPKGYKGKKGLPDLGHWVQQQRYMYSRSLLQLKRLTLLEAIPGWEWKTTKKNRSSHGGGVARALSLRRKCAPQKISGAIVPRELRSHCTESKYWQQSRRR